MREWATSPAGRGYPSGEARHERSSCTQGEKTFCEASRASFAQNRKVKGPPIRKALLNRRLKLRRCAPQFRNALYCIVAEALLSARAPTAATKRDCRKMNTELLRPADNALRRPVAGLPGGIDQSQHTTLATSTELAVGFGPRVTLGALFKPHTPLINGSPVLPCGRFDEWLCSRFVY